MMFWLIRATQISSLTYRLLLSTMMAAYLLREGLSNAKKRKLQKLLPPPEPSL